MRHSTAPIKQSGDVHPPEVDDGYDEIDTALPVDSRPAMNATAASASPRRQELTYARNPSPAPLLALLAGLFLLYRLMR